MQPEAFSLSNSDFTTLLEIGQKQFTSEKIIEQLCNYFLGVPYELLKPPEFSVNLVEHLLQCLVYKEEPDITADGLDCVTFVETVLALALAMHCRDLQIFKAVFRSNLISLRYHNGIACFLRRNYFFSCIDWIPNNKWLVHDISKEICNNISYAHTTINKLAWLYQYELLNSYREELTITELDIILKNLGVCLQPIKSILPYIASQELLNDYDNCVKRFPVVSVVCIVRPNWDVTDLYQNYGTHLNISHLGICIKKADCLYFYHATSTGPKAVTVERLDEYLSKYLDSKTVKGIHVVKCKF